MCNISPMGSFGETLTMYSGCYWCEMLDICKEIAMGNDFEDFTRQGEKSEAYECVTVNYDKLIAETKKGVKNQGAILFLIEGEEVWIPKSDKVMTALWREDKQVEVYHWFAEKNGLLITAYY